MKKILSMVLALAIVFTLAACAGESEENASSSTPANQASSSDPAGQEPATKIISLCTSRRTESPASTLLQQYSFDASGRLTGMEYSQEYTTVDYSKAYFLRYEYNDDDTIAQILFGDDDESITLIASYENGQLVSYLGEADGDTCGWRFAYNEAGQLCSILLVEKENQKEVIALEYHASGVLAKRTTFDASMTRTDCFNTSGLLIETTVYPIDGSAFLSRNRMEYNENGQIIRQETYLSGSETPLQTMEYAYDEAGRQNRIKVSSADLVYDLSGTWDAENKTVTFAYQDGETDISITALYDDENRCICTTTYNGGQVTSSTATEYISLEVPAEYEPLNTADPQYLLFALGI